MRLLYSLVSLFLITFALASPLAIEDALAVRDDINLADLIKFVEGIEQAKRDLESSDDVSLFKRAQENVALTQAFTALNKSGQGVSLVKTFATNPATQPTVIASINSYLQKESLTTLFQALDQSNLALDVVITAFSDPNFLPGLWKIVTTLWDNGEIHLKREDYDLPADFDKRGLLDGLLGAVGSIIGTAQQTLINSIVALVAQVADPISICISLDKSGLGVSVIKSAVEDSQMQTFVVNLVTKIIDDKTITLGKLIDAENGSGLVVNTVKKIISNTTYLQIIFVWVVKFLVSLIKYVI
ncbi:uncharacterized protein RJT20DRAFT_37778 [Scheffersomyces xylosifermentans]|uniref:uncharacterized protein n=1 Tax=Scheffersomyces xylosifermentans TaxID=1304137 RepID=UPI00315CC8DF